tara:strand:- start:497 stop:826 length:330 start_codon:yes stop_codon:yes gene_type:complete
MNKTTISKWTAISAVTVAIIGLMGSVLDLYKDAEIFESKGVAMEDEIVETITSLHATIETMETRIVELERLAHPLATDKIKIKPKKRKKGKARGYKRQWAQQQVPPQEE